jgi:hypothetical protein
MAVSVFFHFRNAEHMSDECMCFYVKGWKEMMTENNTNDMSSSAKSHYV